MKFLIACLGNIGEEYLETRHNIGFKVADALLTDLSKENPSRFETGRLASTVTLKFRGRVLTIIKPSTYMNLSGNALAYWMQKENTSKENILVITDDLALPFGTLRLRSKGSDGGHNGLKSIQETLGTVEYPRLRFGIGNEFSKGKQVDYVLGKWTEEELKTLTEKIDLSVEIVKSFMMAGLPLTMNRYNNK